MTTEAPPIIEEKQIVKRKFKEPKKYKVMVLNDDYTPMEFVIVMLIRLFKHSESQAMAVTQKIHVEGSAVAGIYSHEIAEQKALDATELARSQGHPLILKVVEQ
jgi:ATP-dependent Clp protease adaptor protein ClpS